MTIWIPDLTRHIGPRYKALADAIAQDIKAGILKPKQKLPTHRFLASELGVTVGTITRGYAEAERRELVEAKIGSGTFVSSEKAPIHDFLITPDEDSAVIDLSLSMTIIGNQEKYLSKSLSEIKANPILLKNACGFHPGFGLKHHRKAAESWLKADGVEANAERIVICAGAQHAINLAVQATTKPGDVILSESITYPGFNIVAKQRFLKQQGLPMDEDGIIPEKLDEYCQRHQPKVLYCIPTLQNPSVIICSETRRLDLVKVIQKHQLLVIEDEAQSSLMDKRPTPLVNLIPEQVIHISSCSKSLSGGIRIGYLLCPERITPLVGTVLRSNCWMVPPLMSEIATQWINNGYAKELVRDKQLELQIRHRAINEILKDAVYNSHEKCLNIWLYLPDPWRSQEFVNRVGQKGVSIKSSEVFAAGRQGVPHAVRISVGGQTSFEKMKEGYQIISETLKEPPVSWQPVI
jgi:DNA-binding transcriptional MocR family regulator